MDSLQPTSPGLYNTGVQDINQLVQDYQAGWGATLITPTTGIIRSHWVSSAQRSKCMSCHVKFSLTERHHHCRLCGEVYCAACTSFQRRLNILAHPDPGGKLYKVCRKCFEQGPQTIGFSKNWMQTFEYFKSGRHLALDTPDGPIKVTSLREKLDLDKEYRRLKTGFEQSIKNATVLKRSLSEVMNTVTTPDWQKATNFPLEKLSEKCSACRKQFGITRKRYHCSVCGAAVCSDCANKDLIVFIPDGSPPGTAAHIAVIKIVGCPEEEPSCCVYLRSCGKCRQRQEDRQVADYKQQLHAEQPQVLGFMDRLEEINNKLTEVQAKIEHNLPRYQQLVEALDLGARSHQKSEARDKANGASNIQTLAKAQGDLADHFSQFVMTIQSLKTLKPASQTQSMVFRNVVKSKCTYYQDKMFAFREMRRNLEEVTPAEVLSSIQDIVDKNAINSCYLSVKQLTFEVIHLSAKYDIEESIAQALIKVEGRVCEDLKQCILSSSGDTWSEHEAIINQLMQEQLKGHRLVRPSRRLTKKLGGRHVAEVMQQRSNAVLQQILLQMKSKCADSSFINSKEAIKNCLDSLDSMTVDTDMVNEDGWVEI